jgi:hypothetical protein
MEANPVQKTLAAQVRDIIQDYGGDRFAVDDVVIDLEAEGIQYKTGSVRAAISRMVHRGLVKVVDQDGRAKIYQQIAAQCGPDTRKQTFTAICFAAMTGLERFSLQALAHGVASGGVWTHGEALQKAPSVIARVRQMGLLGSTRTRPAIYSLAPQWYRDNAPQISAYCQMAPHLEARIRAAFGKYCGPADVDQTVKPPEEKIYRDPAPALPSTPSRSAAVDLLKHRIEDQGLNLIHAKNRARDLEQQNRKLQARIERLSDVVDQKNRINATLQKRLNDIRQGSGQGNRGGTFALADVVRVEGKAIDASKAAPDLPKAEGGTR